MDQDSNLWKQFSVDYCLSNEQLDQYKKYYDLLCFWNKRFNLTRIIKLNEVILYHFVDSIKLNEFYDFEKIHSISDIGAGAGFPGIPLKILHPHLSLIPIEVSSKKIKFLNTIREELGLENVEVCPLDWRTFLRTTNYKIDLFCARASLQSSELVRVFKSVSPYKNSELVYWASHFWKIGAVESEFFLREEEYCLEDKKRKYIFFGKKSF